MIFELRTTGVTLATYIGRGNKSGFKRNKGINNKVGLEEIHLRKGEYRGRNVASKRRTNIVSKQ